MDDADRAAHLIAQTDVIREKAQRAFDTELAQWATMQHKLDLVIDRLDAVLHRLDRLILHGGSR